MRAPLWPFVASVPIRACGQCSLVETARFTGALMNTIAALAVGLLAWMLSGSLSRMWLATIVTAVLPETQPYLAAGMSEPLSAALIAAATVLLSLERGFYAGVLLLSLLPLARPYFLILPFFIAGIAWVFRKQPRIRAAFGSSRRLLAAAVLFFLPSLAWMLRNYEVTGQFPVMTGLEGVSFYGGYNVVTSSFGPDLGGWIHPDHVPGQESRYDLSRRMSEIETLRYYRAKGLQFITQHWRRLPMLFAARVVRTLLPNPLAGPLRYFYWLTRLAVLALALIVVWRNPPALANWYGIMLAATALVTIATVVLYFGEERYLYQLMILVLAYACAAGFRRAESPAEDRSQIECASR